MDYYRRYTGDYLSKTLLRSMIEDGAYTRMLDFYYTSEGPLPPSLEDVYLISRAKNASEKAAVRKVLEAHFDLKEDGYHNARADKELGVAVPKIEKLREVARENGRKSKGRPKKLLDGNPDRLNEKTESGSENKPTPKPDPVPTRASQATANRQPPTKDKTVSPVSASTVEEARPIGSLTVALALGEARIDPETPAAILASVCVANGIAATAFHPLVVDWAHDGITVDGLKSAIATARMRKPAPQKIPLAYLDTILADAGAPKANARWRTDDAECERVARELGLWPARAKESWQELRGRIAEALHGEARSAVR